ncbi:hypothetical protein [Raineyella sp. W15-4]|uniref:hypothetical protein n=1 Tax=Raineyella sp. W15-4 TaxID=3081651 RepID=UPI0029535A70|nr:hypothetical protein [Raineyella sp. W15-4]WOQ17842.1 hypothetical protein R0145_03805 [Raineyella sp. W15-4]
MDDDESNIWTARVPAVRRRVETLDHTSIIRFIEARFGVQEPQITPWRRAVAGDLTVTEQAHAGAIAVTLHNAGRLGAHFQARLVEYLKAWRPPGIAVRGR